MPIPERPKTYTPLQQHTGPVHKIHIFCKCTHIISLAKIFLNNEPSSAHDAYELLLLFNWQILFYRFGQFLERLYTVHFHLVYIKMTNQTFSQWNLSSSMMVSLVNIKVNSLYTIMSFYKLHLIGTFTNIMYFFSHVIWKWNFEP